MSLLLTVNCRGFSFDLYKENLNNYRYESFQYGEDVTMEQLVEARDALCRNLNRGGYDATVLVDDDKDTMKVLIKNVNND